MAIDMDDLSKHVRKIESGIDEIKKEQKTFEKKIIRRSALIMGIIVLVIAMISVTASDVYYLKAYKEQDTPTPSFVIENLRGDTVDTWVYWLLTSYQELHVHLLNSPQVTDERTQIIRDAIMSTETVEVDDSLLHKGPQGSKSVYYLGWKGALDSIESKTRESIPKNLHFAVVDSEQGNVIIKLTNTKNMDGYSAFTKSIVDESNHQVIKSTITVYDADKLSNEQLATVVRHEFGHALGLAHSTAPEDLMAPVIPAQYPYVSQCDIDAIRSLYDGNQKSQVVCEK